MPFKMPIPHCIYVNNPMNVHFTKGFQMPLRSYRSPYYPPNSTHAKMHHLIFC